MEDVAFEYTCAKYSASEAVAHTERLVHTQAPGSRRWHGMYLFSHETIPMDSDNLQSANGLQYTDIYDLSWHLIARTFLETPLPYLLDENESGTLDTEYSTQ